VAKWRAAFVADIHLGKRACQAERLCAWLAANPADVIYIVGDLLDGCHALCSNKLGRVVRAISEAAPRVVLTPGNHDDFLRALVGNFGRLEVCRTAFHTAADGRRYVVVHGDEFDPSLRGPLPALGSMADGFARRILPARRVDAAQRTLNRISTRGALPAKLAAHARENGAAGVIHGHFHEPGIREFDGFVVADCGDWIGTCTALVERHDGQFQILKG
jgi:UDP-2,3-diacylglucosamine pyrophosphatase LpxH